MRSVGCERPPRRAFYDQQKKGDADSARPGGKGEGWKEGSDSVVLDQGLKGNVLEDVLEQLGGKEECFLVIRAKAAKHKIQGNLRGRLSSLLACFNGCCPPTSPNTNRWCQR